MLNIMDPHGVEPHGVAAQRASWASHMHIHIGRATWGAGPAQRTGTTIDRGIIGRQI